MGVKLIPKGMTMWPAQDIVRPVEEVVQMYQNGTAGCFFDPEARDELIASMHESNGAGIANVNNFMNSGVGKLTMLWLAAVQHWPLVWPCPGQGTGDCVGHGGKNAAIILIGVEAALGIPDPVSGVYEGFPEVSQRGQEQGVVACENIYGDRGHSGQGASCSRLQHYTTTKGGIMLRKNYEELGVDFTDYDVSLEAGWGRNGTPAAVNAEGQKHQFRAATNCDTHEVVRDFVANGYPIWTCSSLGWSSTRDENGFSKRSGSWAHSWIVDGYDDRAETKSKYGFPLFHYNHDWARWNGGGRRVLGTQVDIPEGSFWGDARLLDNVECTAMSNINGWPGREMPDFMVL